MTRRTRTRTGRAALALAFVAAAAAGAAGGGTLASFSNTTQNPTNSFQSATLSRASGLSVSEICGGGGIAFRGAASNGSDGSPLVISKPTGVVEGDVMIAVVVTRFNTEDPTAPSGWTLVRNDAPGLRQKIWYKVAGASEPTSYSFSGTGRSAGGIVAYSGVDTSNPIDAHDAQTGSGSTITAPSITTTSANTMLMGVFAIRHKLSFTFPGSMTQRVSQISAGSGGDDHHVRSAIAEEAFVGPGATGSRQATSALSASNVGVLLALRSVPTQWDASLSWTATPTTWASGYKVQRWSGGSMQNEQTVTPRTTTTATDGPLAANTAYEFRVLAYYGTWRSTDASITLTTGAGCGSGVSGGGDVTSYRDEVLADSPTAYWRLGETVTLSDDFETFSGWTDYTSGTFAQSSEQARSGSSSGKKNTNNDPNGGWKPLGATLGNDWTLETWLYRPAAYTGGAADRIGIEDGSFNGYSFYIDHSGSTINIDRRAAGVATALGSTVAANPPEDGWFRAVLDRSGSNLTFTIYDTAGVQIAQKTTTDSTYSSFTRVVVHGGYHYYVDDLKVTTTATSAVDEQGTYGGTYAGGVTTGQGGALIDDADSSVSMDGTDDYAIRNPFGGMPATAISVEFWMKSSNTSKSGTPVSYAVSSTENNEFLIFNYNNFSIHIDGASVGTGVSGNNGAWHHFVVTWRSSDGQTKLYKDGVQAWSGTLSAGGSIQNSGSLVLGQEQDAVGGGFDATQAFLGNLDEVAVYNTVLSATRVQAHYDAGT